MEDMMKEYKFITLMEKPISSQTYELHRTDRYGKN